MKNGAATRAHAKICVICEIGLAAAPRDFANRACFAEVRSTIL